MHIDKIMNVVYRIKGCSLHEGNKACCYGIRKFRNLTIASTNQRTNGPVNAHLISWPSKAQNIQNLKNKW